MSIDQLNQANAAVRAAVRAASPNRTLILAGLEWSDVYWLAANPDALVVDFYDAVSGAVDEHVALEVHDYQPTDFTWNGGTTSWGTPDDVAARRDMFAGLRAWSAAHRGVGVVLGEFGCVSAQPNQTARALYFDTMFALAPEYNVAPVIWSDFGLYVVYNESSREFDPAVLGALE